MFIQRLDREPRPARLTESRQTQTNTDAVIQTQTHTHTHTHTQTHSQKHTQGNANMFLGESLCSFCIQIFFNKGKYFILDV